ncbi:MAG: hypothetical protein JWP34_1880 [Massilia sp.]|nr:hypothetical protein [Massilia sp.]
MYILLKDKTMHNTVFSMRHVVAIAALALSGSAFAAGQDGQTVFKDPQTGKLRNPTAEEAKQLNDLRAAQRAAGANERKASGAPQANVARLQANGVVQAFVDEESISYSVMTRNAAGELVLQCVTGATAAKEVMSTPATTESKEHQHEVQ